MTVKELIDRLQKCNPEHRVILEYIDNTDWVYKMEFGEDEFESDFEMYMGESENYETGESEDILENCVLIVCKEENEVTNLF